MAPVRVARAFRYSMIATMTALALAGCMRRSAPVAVAQPRSDLDSLAYGQPADAAPRSVYMSATNVAPSRATNVAPSGGAVAAIRSGFAAAPRHAYAPAPAVGYAAPMPVAYDAAYRLDAGDRLRVVVYGQEGLTNTYAIDAGGSITLPLIGAVRARGLTPAGLASEITGKLRNGYIREPSVAVEIEAYRPFFILGEVAAPGQYPYVPNMSVESAVAIAGGFSPRAKRDRVTVTHTDAGGSVRAVVPMGTPISPGDTVLVGERWF
jgi:polysaccharide export outer membrane protein